MKKYPALLCFVVGLWLSGVPSIAAVDMFLKIEGVPGESTDNTHRDEIDILSWSWGATQSGTMHTGGGGSAGSATFGDISVTKYVDKASPLLMLHCANGNSFPSATLYVRKAGGTPLEYVKIAMTKVMITRVDLAMVASQSVQTEQISLNFESFRYEYVPQKPDGSADAAVRIEWDIPTNTGGTD